MARTTYIDSILRIRHKSRRKDKPEKKTRTFPEETRLLGFLGDTFLQLGSH